MLVDVRTHNLATAVSRPSEPDSMSRRVMFMLNRRPSTATPRNGVWVLIGFFSRGQLINDVQSTHSGDPELQAVAGQRHERRMRV